LETDAKDVKPKRAQRGAKNNPSVTYTPHSDATPEGELAALGAVYAFAIQAHKQKKAVASAEERVREEVNPKERQPGRDK
jgi:hypothetical protein